MHFKYNVQFQKVGDTYIGVAVGKDKESFSDYLTFNETGYDIAVQMKGDITKQQLINNLLEEYEADRPFMEECVDEIINYLTEKGVLWTE